MIYKVDHPYIRYPAAILLSPPIGSVIAYLFLTIGYILFAGDERPFFNWQGIILVTVLIYAYPTMFFGGILFLFFASRYKYTQLWHYLVAGPALALVCAFVILGEMRFVLTDLFISLRFVLGGLCCAAVCWAFLFLPIKKAAGEPPSSN